MKFYANPRRYAASLSLLKRTKVGTTINNGLPLLHWDEKSFWLVCEFVFSSLLASLQLGVVAPPAQSVSSSKCHNRVAPKLKS